MITFIKTTNSTFKVMKQSAPHVHYQMGSVFIGPSTGKLVFSLHVPTVTADELLEIAKLMNETKVEELTNA